ncbi:30S ribosomal protein S4 [Candidatus Vampirococcus lugosii]|uniref:Small ribosomal subunit protein uS4 n=1 Tax=Candidatus Vampirococcus lugosii TaxID=2789015 RepID=A0ABS5QJI0_9BACT|nr:30S ribosomal protein S4 [Candidatus Vampirococcus lugosii]MBS8121442.1 30S ribosomal protein S4 [Candidatus Vampirococcus lugosii]
MKYNGPKFKLCRREGINLFGVNKYDVRKRKKTPGQHGVTMSRLSEYGKLLRNKQVIKRMYLLTEKQFKRTVIDEAGKYAKNKGVSHDEVAIQFLERRLDSVVLRAGLANTIMQARQMVGHGHFLLNGKKHNSSSYFVKVGDKISLKSKLITSPLYSSIPLSSGNYKLPTWLNVKKDNFEIEVIDFPRSEEISLPADILKVIEFYARA